MQRALTISGLLVAVFIGALLATALRFPIPETISDWLTPAIGLAAIAQALFAFWALDGVRHSRQQAEAATLGLAAMQDTAQRQLRAYVVVELRDIENADSEERPEGSVRVRNVGQTPAHNVSTLIYVTVANPGQRVELPDPDDVSRIHLVIGSGLDKINSQTATFSLTPDGIAAVKARQSLIVVGGCTVYEDVFGKTWHTQFCHIYDGPALMGRYHTELNRGT